MSGTLCCNTQAGSCFCGYHYNGQPNPKSFIRKTIGKCICGCGLPVYEKKTEESE